MPWWRLGTENKLGRDSTWASSGWVSMPRLYNRMRTYKEFTTPGAKRRVWRGPAQDVRHSGSWEYSDLWWVPKCLDCAGLLLREKRGLLFVKQSSLVKLVNLWMISIVDVIVLCLLLSYLHCVLCYVLPVFHVLWEKRKLHLFYVCGCGCAFCYVHKLCIANMELRKKWVRLGLIMNYSMFCFWLFSFKCVSFHHPHGFFDSWGSEFISEPSGLWV